MWILRAGVEGRCLRYNPATLDRWLGNSSHRCTVASLTKKWMLCWSSIKSRRSYMQWNKVVIGALTCVWARKGDIIGLGVMDLLARIEIKFHTWSLHRLCENQCDQWLGCDGSWPAPRRLLHELQVGLRRYVPVGAKSCWKSKVGAGYFERFRGLIWRFKWLRNRSQAMDSTRA